MSFRGDFNEISPSSPEARSTSGALAEDWSDLVHRIHRNDQRAIEELHSVLSRGARSYLRRQIGPEHAEDAFHDVLLIVIKAIQKGDLRDPKCLMGFVRTVLHRQVAVFIKRKIERPTAELHPGLADSSASQETEFMRAEKVQIMKSVLREMSLRDREMLTRFYLLEQPKERICEEMGLTETQFRLLKSRAKAEFGELGKKTVGRCGRTALFRRAAAASAS